MRRQRRFQGPAIDPTTTWLVTTLPSNGSE